MGLGFEQLVLGIFQGIVEWLPFSSEGVLLFVKAVFFNKTQVNMELFIRQALFLHLGTFFAALIYFWKDIKELAKGVKHYDKADFETKKTLDFLVIATIVSGIVGLAALKIMDFINTEFLLTSKIVAFLVGGLLLFNGFMQLKASRSGIRKIFHLKDTDSLFAGFMQGLASFPGLSRSGLTISALLFRRVDETTALRLSFLMSLPIILIGNIVLNLSDFQFVGSMIWGFITAFVFGYITIHGLMKLARRIRFGWFVIIMATLIILSGIFVPR